MNKVLVVSGLMLSLGLALHSQAMDEDAVFGMMQREKEHAEGLLNGASGELFNTELFKSEARGTVGGIKKELSVAVQAWNNAVTLVGTFIERRTGDKKDAQHLQLIRFLHELSIESHKLTHLVTVINNAFMLQATHKMYGKKLNLEGYKRNLTNAQDSLLNLAKKVSEYPLDNEAMDFSGKVMAKSLITLALKYLESGANTAMQAIEREME